MIEIVPACVNSALLYFHTAHSSGNEITPFLEELQAGLPHTYLWAGDGGIEGSTDPLMGRSVSYGNTAQRYWFVFPMQGNGSEDFARVVVPMGAVLVTCGGYVNTLVDQLCARFSLPASRVVLCGHQHGACVALAAAMIRRADPFALTVLFDPWPLETLYLEHEQDLPPTRVVCVDNAWVRERERQRGAEVELYKVFRSYGIQAEGITLAHGGNKPDADMFREVIRLVQATAGGL